MHRAVLHLFSVVALCACTSDARPVQPMTATPEVDSSKLADALRAVASRRVYFAHQSVGENIIAGLEALAREHPDAGLTTVATRDPSVLATGTPLFVHFRAGTNEQPATKNADFLRFLARRPRPDSGIAMLKYCYVDALDPRPARQIFDDYVRTVATIRERYPDLTIVHVTMPLGTVPTGMRARVKEMLGRDLGKPLAVKRNAYNTLLRDAYRGKEPLFDLAELEARRPDGAPVFFSSGAETIPALAPELTWDDGHLNLVGQRLAAQALVMVLARAGVR